MKSAIHTLVAASALAVLAACGGGGDSTSQPFSNSLAINATNQTDVARASINGGLAISLTQGSLGGGASSSAVVGRSQATAATLAHVLHVATGQRKGVASAGAQVSAVSSSSAACIDGGSVSTSFDDKDGNSMLSNGDVLTVTFSQCQESATASLNGTMVITLTATPTDTLIAANVQFQNVSAIDSGSTATISGTAGITETDGPSTSDSSITVGSAGLTVGVASTGYNDSLVFDSGTVVTTSESSANGTTSATATGGFTSRFLSGHVAIATPTALLQADADPYPRAGAIRVTGASGSTLLITVLDSTQVQLQLDANGDGSYESTTTVAWSTLVH